MACYLQYYYYYRFKSRPALCQTASRDRTRNRRLRFERIQQQPKVTGTFCPINPPARKSVVNLLVSIYINLCKRHYMVCSCLSKIFTCVLCGPPCISSFRVISSHVFCMQLSVGYQPTDNLQTTACLIW